VTAATAPRSRGRRRQPSARRDRLWLWRHPSRLIAAALAGLIAIGTGLLLLPAATVGPGSAPFRTALFTSTSAAALTGLVIEDTGTYWTPFGQVVILLLFQIGGIGVASSATLVAMLIAGRMGLRSRLIAEYETHAMSLGTVRRVLGSTVLVAGIAEAVVAVLVTGRLWLGEGYPIGRAAWSGTFHAVSAFNNAGFALWPDSLSSFATDPWIVIPLTVAIIVGGLGVLVVFELARVHPAAMWSVHTKITLTVTAILLVLGPLALIAGEWHNPATLGAHDPAGRILAGVFSGITPRTAGFSIIDYGQAGPGSLLITDILMFIGGGSGSTAGGIKVTALTILLMSVVAEARGDQDVNIFGRRISPPTVRQALAVATLGMAVLIASTLVMLEITDLPLDNVLFEVTSALCTTGLSTGITAALPPAGQYLLIGLMYLGRIGSITVVTALALRSASRAYRYPEGRPVVG
jgi:trk system potassium uptake protein TrkH